MSDESVKHATGRDWAEWIAILDSGGARDMPHAEIVRRLSNQGLLTKSWWGQMVTVGYEQAIGRRSAGQSCSTDYTVNATKTLSGDLDTALSSWLSRVSGEIQFRDVPLADEPKVSATAKWRYWRATLADGSAVNVNIGMISESKVGLAIEHMKLSDEQSAAEWKSYWKEMLAGDS